MTKEEVFQIVKRNVMAVLPALPPGTITLDKHLKELGANSIDRMEIITATLEDLGLKMPLVELGEIKGIEGLVTFLYEKKCQ